MLQQVFCVTQSTTPKLSSNDYMKTIIYEIDSLLIVNSSIRKFLRRQLNSKARFHYIHACAELL
jgi:hypothetical protein